MLKNPAYFNFYLWAAVVAFVSAAFGSRVFHIRKLDLKPQISLDIFIEMVFDAKKHCP